MNRLLKRMLKNVKVGQKRLKYIFSSLNDETEQYGRKRIQQKEQ